MYCEKGPEQSTFSLQEQLKNFPDIYHELGLILQVIKDAERIYMEFIYRPDWVEHDDIDQMAIYLSQILNQASQNPEVPMDILTIGNGKPEGATIFDEDDFNFS